MSLLTTHKIGSSILKALGAAALLSTLAGCGMTAADNLPANLKISGKMMGGRQPISGSSMTLYITGTTGYGSAATVLGTATTQSDGTFTISRNANTCTGSQQLYLVGSGGDAGSGANSAAMLVEALGGCGSVTTSTTGLVINELTTVAAAYALQAFADTGVNIGTSSTNAQGLSHAFSNALNLVTINGTVNSTTPGSVTGATGTVPTAVVNTIANILASCVNSTGPSSTPCSTILLGAPTVVSAPTPTNVWQEALNMARYPAYQTAALWGIVTSTGPFQSTLSAQPNDFSIGIGYSAGYQTNGTTLTNTVWDIKADANDNIWVSGMTNAGLAELSPQGVLLSPSAGGWSTNPTLQTDFTRGVGIDSVGTIWLADAAGYIWKYVPGGTATSPTQGTTSQITANTVLGPVAIGVDGSNNVWFGTYNSTASTSETIGEVASGGSSASYPTNGAYGASTKGTYFLAVDANTNYVFAPTQSAGIIYQYSAPATTAPTATTTLGANPANGVAIDKNAALWLVYQGSGSNNGSLSKYTEGATSATYTCKVTVSAGNGLYNPRGVVIDGNNRIFVMSYTAGSIIEFDPALGSNTGCGTSNPGTFFTTTTGTGIEPSTSAAVDMVASPRNVTIDSSGAMWVGNNTTSTTPVIQVLGIAAPVNPVLSAGKYGVKP